MGNNVTYRSVSVYVPENSPVSEDMLEDFLRSRGLECVSEDAYLDSVETWAWTKR